MGRWITPQKSKELIPKMAIFEAGVHLFQGPSFWVLSSRSFSGMYAFFFVAIFHNGVANAFRSWYTSTSVSIERPRGSLSQSCTHLILHFGKLAAKFSIVPNLKMDGILTLKKISVQIP